MKLFRKFPICLVAALTFFAAFSAKAADIPQGYMNIHVDDTGHMFYVSPNGDTLPQSDEPAKYGLSKIRNRIHGTDDGIVFEFPDTTYAGRIYYGFIPSLSETKHPYPVYFKRSAKLTAGIAEIKIASKMSGKYDFIDWETTGMIRLGYRITTSSGTIIYDGKIVLRGTGPFVVDTCIIEGPLVNLLSESGAVISFETNFPIRAEIHTGDKTFTETMPGTHHEIAITGLTPNTDYRYTVVCGDLKDRYSLHTAPSLGSRASFTFAYASDGRGNNGGGERYIYGVNGYILKKIIAMCQFRNTRFFQFTGDLVDGYCTDPDEIRLEYANWKRAADPFAAYFPIVASFGNHEAVSHYFRNDTTYVEVDQFPYKTRSAETLFAENFVNPLNGPESEDGAVYDPDPDNIDFPSYKENAFYYTYDNVAMISLNSNYWYTVNLTSHPDIGGNLHGYVMDNQLTWLEETVELLENNAGIDHIFVTIHTPIFPNGGHVGDDMWYRGNNDFRPQVAGKPVEKGIIERRDQILDILVNRNSKIVAVLTGDEHNYNRLVLTDSLPIYPADWAGEKLHISRPLWLINNGAAGAPYYGQEQTPWSEYVEGFSVQNALVFFNVDGPQIDVEVYNPDTWEKFDSYTIR